MKIKQVNKNGGNVINTVTEPVEPPYQSETSKCRKHVLAYCQGNGVDLGSGGDPVTPTALQIESIRQYTPDLGGKYPVQFRGDARQLYWFKDRCLDYVYSSHLLEDFRDWTPLLDEWMRVIKPGGFLVLLIPDRERFAAAVANGQPPNLAHQHEGSVGELTNAIRKLGGFDVIKDQFVDDTDYNIMFVAQRHC